MNIRKQILNYGFGTFVIIFGINGVFGTIVINDLSEMANFISIIAAFLMAAIIIKE